MTKNSDAIAENKKWVDLSVKFSSYEEFLMPVIQGIGRFSLYLDEIDKYILQDIQGGRNATIEFSQKLTDAFTLSYFWVLGAYEAIRTLSEHADKAEKEGALEKKVADEIRKLKHLFEEIRMPLAKMQVPRRFKDNPDSSAIAYPSLDARRGIAWNLGKNKFISRKELSETFLGLENIDFALKKEK